MKTEAEAMARIRISITLPQECIDWIDKQVEARKFFSRSHAIEVLILKEMKAS
jgi:Arc/MetJ-type ribon-helix-helix transcriptional regulator